MTMVRFRQMTAWLLLFAVVMVSSAPAPAFADDRAGKLEIHKAGSMDSKENCRDKYQGKLIAVLVPCIRDVIQNATETMTSQFDDVVENATWAFTTLVITLFGVKMAMREGDLKKQGAILLFKIAGMSLFIQNFGGFIPQMFGMVQESVEIVSSALGDRLGGAQCDTSTTMGEKPWNYMDCVLGELMGFGPRATIGTAVFGMLSAPFGSKFGPIFTLGGVVVIFFIIRLILRAVYTYLMSILVMGFLIVMSPLLIPLILLGVTFQYFEHWLRALTSSMLMPMIVVAYVTLSFLALDKMLYDPEKGLAKQMTEDDAKKAHNQLRGSGVSSSYMGNQDHIGNTSFYKHDYARRGDLLPQTVGYSGTSNFNQRYGYDFRDKDASKSQSIFFSMLCFVIMAYLLDTMLDELVKIAQMLLGGAFALGRATMDNPIENKLNELKQSALGTAGQGGSLNSALSGSSQYFEALKSLYGRR